MNEQAMRFRMGLFVLTALVLLGVMVSLFGSFPTFFRNHHEYTVVFTDAPGLGAGAPVHRSGVRIGEVKSLDLDCEEGTVRVQLLIEKRYTLHRNEQPTLVQGLLGSDACIDLVPCLRPGQEPDRTIVEPGEVLTGARQASMSTLLSRASEVVPSTQETLNDVRQSLRRFEQMAPLLEETIREYRDLARATREAVPELRRTNDEVRELARASREIVPSLGKTSDEVRELAKGVRETIPELRRTNDQIQITAQNWGKFGDHMDVFLQTNQDKMVRSVEAFTETLTRIGSVFNEENQRNLSGMLAHVRVSSENLESVTKNTDDLIKESKQTVHRIGDSVVHADETLNNLQQASKPLADRSSSIMKNLDESTDKLNKTLAEMRELLKLLANGDGTVHRLVTDPALYNHLDETACAMARLMPRLERMLQDLELFADKIARHPEALGLGGVVTPGSGLKK